MFSISSQKDLLSPVCRLARRKYVLQHGSALSEMEDHRVEQEGVR